MRQNNWVTLSGAILGGLLAQLAWVACGGSARSQGTSGTAAAQSVTGSSGQSTGTSGLGTTTTGGSGSGSASTCSQWEVQSFAPPALSETPVSNGSGSNYNVVSIAPFTLPAGWEPIGAISVYAVLGRHCVGT